MKKFLLLLSALILFVGCNKKDAATLLTTTFENGTERVKAADDLEAFNAATKSVTTEVATLKSSVSAEEYEAAEKDDKVQKAEAEYAAACLEKAAGLGADALKNVFSGSSAGLTKLIDSAAGVLEKTGKMLPDASEEFDKALEDAAKAIEALSDSVTTEE